LRVVPDGAGAAQERDGASALRVLPDGAGAALVGPARSEPAGLPVLAALERLLPGGLPRGQVVTVDGIGALPLALVAGAVAVRRPTEPGPDHWCAVVGLPDAGVLAAAEMGADPDRMLLVDQPGERWAEIVATLMTAMDVILFRPASPPAPGMVRRLMALARQHRVALVVVGGWDGAVLRLQVTASLWTGLGDGHGHLQGRRVQVVADGRGAGQRPRSAWLWLPAPDGTVATADLEAVA
jgi:hypothetical protein